METTTTFAPELRNAIDNAAHLAAPMFRTHRWTYGALHEHVPDLDEITETLEHLVSIVIEDKLEGLSSGRFTVTRTVADPGEFDIEITLELAWVNGLYEEVR